MLQRLFHLIIKELQAILGNKQGRILLLMPVIIQTVIFPFAATLEVRNATLAIYNQDSGPMARELIQRFSHTGAFKTLLMIHSETGLRQAIDSETALLALRIPADFSRRLSQQKTAELQILLDGRHSNSAQIAGEYVSDIIQQLSDELSLRAPAKLTIRNIYNPNLNYRWHILPSLVAIITTIGCLLVTALSVAREREEGTFDQLLVSPLTPAYILVGKAVPGVIIAVGQGSLIALAAVWVYQMPFNGSVAVLFTGMVCYGLALSGVGLFISSLVTTQQQAFLGVFAFMVPAVILSGYVAPIENMPAFFQLLAHGNPLTFFIEILKGVFLKEFGFEQAWTSLWPLLLIASGSLSVALAMFRRHIA